MIHYHGTPITPNNVLIKLKGKHFFVSFWRPDNIGVVGVIASTFAIDNGAFSAWTKGVAPDWGKYAEFVDEWRRHPAFDWHVIPDVIDGSERENDRMIEDWGMAGGVPVWHLHESLERLALLAESFPRIALGSSGEYATTGTPAWWDRMDQVMATICDDRGRPICKVHGMRMLDTRFRVFPLHSADSTNLAQNLTDPKVGRAAKAEILIDRIESTQSAESWSFL